MNLRSQYESIREEVDAAVLRVLASGHYALGPEVDAFESEFAHYCGVAYAVGVSSGTSALHLALLASGIGQGDEVITTPLTFVATIAAILYSGARPILADIDPETLTIDPRQVEKKITPRTRAIVPVHLHGQMADVDHIIAVAEPRGIAVVEDAAQSHGAELDGRKAGSIGHAGCFSFYPTKNLGAAGEAGIVTTNDERLARRVKRLRDWGQKGKSNHVEKGYNHRMDAIQAAVIRAKLAHLDTWNDARRARAKLYDRLLANSGVMLPREGASSRHVYHVYAVRSLARDELRAWVAARGIETAIHYNKPVHLQPGYADLGYAAGDFPEAERAADEMISLPIYPELTDADVETIADAVTAFR